MFERLLESIDKKYLYLGGGIVLFFFILVALTSCNSKPSSSGTGIKKDDYSAIENLLVESTEKYYTDYPQYRPSEGETVRVSAAKLTAKGYMNDLESYTSEEIKCSGEVAVTKVNSEYKYTPYLDCGSHYSAIALYDYIINKENIYIEGSVEAKYNDDFDRAGLYTTAANDEYYYRGNVTNNYVQIGKYIWRVLKIDSNNYVTLVYDESAVPSIWDNLYNDEFDKNVGINDFNISKIRNKINDIIGQDRYMPNDIRGHLILNKWCIGKRSAEETDMSGKIECSTLSEGTYVGLPSLYEVLRTSLDRKCDNTMSKNCKNDTMFGIDSFWTITGDADDSSKVYYISAGSVYSYEANRSYGAKYTLVLNTTAIRTGGSGTHDDPYLIK